MESKPLLSSPARLVLGLLLLFSLAASVYFAYPAIQARRQNARLKDELLRQRIETERLRGRMDTLRYDKRPTRTYSL